MDYSKLNSFESKFIYMLSLIFFQYSASMCIYWVYVMLIMSWMMNSSFRMLSLFLMIKSLPETMFIMLSVAFFTLLESSVLASMQSSSGPNVVGFYGIGQPMADGMKLLAKELIMSFASNSMIFLMAPLVTFFFALYSWAVVPFGYELVLSDMNFSIFYMFMLSTLSVYCLMMSGWSSNSKYAFLGGLSSSAQLMSYEIVMLLTLLPVFMFSASLNITVMVLSQSFCWNFLMFFPTFVLCFMTLLAETNSVPFDLPEAESELVSGYNVEYSGVGFVFFFLAEYSNMMMMSVVMVCLFFGGWVSFFFVFDSIMWFFMKMFFFLCFFVWMSATLPSLSFDQLMFYCWKIFMPLAVANFVFNFLLFQIV